VLNLGIARWSIFGANLIKHFQKKKLFLAKMKRIQKLFSFVKKLLGQKRHTRNLLFDNVKKLQDGLIELAP
jgi:hypothetical protein